METAVAGLHWPWSVACLPDGGYLITQREGQLLRVDPGGASRPVSGTPSTLFAGQGGLFDVLLHPDFAGNGLVYLSYAEGTVGANATAIFRGRLRDARLEDGRRILRVAQDKSTTAHYGGRMLLLPDASLLLTSGDGYEHREAAQDINSELGKVLRINSRGAAAQRNPFAASSRARIWTYGHRNPQGLALDAYNEIVYLSEHGPRGGDEINLLRPGRNYGWPAVTHGVDYSGAYVSPFVTAPDMTDPIWVWVPSIGPSGLAHYNGELFGAWKDSLLVGALVARDLRRLQLAGGRVVAEEALLGELGERIRDVRVCARTAQRAEEILVLTDGAGGRLLRLLPARSD